MTSIRILCPSRGRPRLARRMLESVRDTSQAQIVFYLNLDDPAIEEYPKEGVLQGHGPDIPPVWAWNILAGQFPAPLMMHAGDDMVFETPGWDERFLEAYEKRKICCIVTHDGREDNSWPHFTVSREWVETLGYFLPPWFLNWCGDVWTTDLAKKTDTLVHFPDIMFRHEKVKDDTWARVRSGDRSWWNARDRDLYARMRTFHNYEAKRLRSAVQIMQEQDVSVLQPEAHGSGERVRGKADKAEGIPPQP